MELSALVSEIGFPAAVCIMLFWNNRDTVKSYEKVLSEFRATLDSNTRAINDLIYKRGNDDGV